MADFTLEAYHGYLSALKSHFPSTMRFTDLVGTPLPAKFCALRHDVDRRPERALAMARLENSLGMVASYYFRMPYTFQPDIIREISALGHEVGYHYEDLSESNGDIDAALITFEKKLGQLRTVAEVSTCCMHGRPMKRYDNRDLWRDPVRHRMLTERFGIRGELYLDINYQDIAYVNDTGRNWTSGVSNRRDHVDSRISASFDSGAELLDYFHKSPHPRLVFQIHPERWTESKLDHAIQRAKDKGTNTAKVIVKMIRP